MLLLSLLPVYLYLPLLRSVAIYRVGESSCNVTQRDKPLHYEKIADFERKNSLSRGGGFPGTSSHAINRYTTKIGAFG